jgi:YfiH family protein
MNKILKGFSERKDGSMYVPLTHALTENIAHRKAFFEKSGLTGKQIAVADLVHGTRVVSVDQRSPYLILETDCLVTKQSDIVLALTGADCFPLFFENKSAGVIGLAHGGWRGIVADIIPTTLTALTALGGNPNDTVLTIGPGICTEHFEIKTDILEQFAAYPEQIFQTDRIRVDLRGIIKKQAEAAGIAPHNIRDSGECTFCLPEKYFSYRRDKPEVLETQIAYIVQFSHRKF